MTWLEWFDTWPGWLEARPEWAKAMNGLETVHGVTKMDQATDLLREKWAIADRPPTMAEFRACIPGFTSPDWVFRHYPHLKSILGIKDPENDWAKLSDAEKAEMQGRVRRMFARIGQDARPPKPKRPAPKAQPEDTFPSEYLEGEIPPLEAYEDVA